jgi:hypothetical protein
MVDALFGLPAPALMPDGLDGSDDVDSFLRYIESLPDGAGAQLQSSSSHDFWASADGAPTTMDASEHSHGHKGHTVGRDRSRGADLELMARVRERNRRAQASYRRRLKVQMYTSASEPCHRGTACRLARRIPRQLPAG